MTMETTGIIDPKRFDRPHREVHSGHFADIAARLIPSYYHKHVDKLGRDGDASLGRYSVTHGENSLGDVMVTVWQLGSDGVKHAYPVPSHDDVIPRTCSCHRNSDVIRLTPTTRGRRMSP